jgi:hypothetical protein
LLSVVDVSVDVLYNKMSEGASLNPDAVEGEGEGDFFFDQSSLQVAPGVNVQALLVGGGPLMMEHAGEEYDVDDDDDEDGEEGEELDGLEVTGHHVQVAASSGQGDGAEEEGGAEDDVEHHT